MKYFSEHEGLNIVKYLNYFSDGSRNFSFNVTGSRQKELNWLSYKTALSNMNSKYRAQYLNTEIHIQSSNSQWISRPKVL